MRVQHSASWQMLEMRARISMRVSSSVIPLIISFSMKSIKRSFTRIMSVQSFPSREAAIIPNIYKHISAFFVLVITVFITLSRIISFIPECISSFFDERSTFLQNFSRVGSYDRIALSISFRKSSGTKCSTFL